MRLMSTLRIDCYRQTKAAWEVNRVAEVMRDIRLLHSLVAAFDMSLEPSPLPSEVLLEDPARTWQLPRRSSLTDPSA